MTEKIPASVIEHIHDVLVGVFLPFDEQINPAEHRDRGRIESALGRPFHTGMGQEFYPALQQKAAALFHSLICNHCFINGNKRTAVIALDLFLLVNRYILIMSTDEIYEMAKATAQGNMDGKSNDSLIENLAIQIGNSMIAIDVIFQDANVKERLGSNYERVMTHVKRTVAFAIKSIEVVTGKSLDPSEVAEDTSPTVSN